MKTAFFVLAVLGLSCGALAGAVQQRGLNEDLQDFIDLVPVQDIIDIIVANENDPEVMAVFEYIFSEDFKKLADEISTIPEYQAVVSYLDAAGVPVKRWIEWLRDLIGSSRKSAGVAPRGLNDVVQQIKGTLDYAAIKALYADKLENSAAFKEMLEKVQSDEFKSLLNNLNQNSSVRELGDRLRAVGVDIDAFIAFMLSIFGLGF